jgi:dihydroorotate dehydrogenase electron transfer subunit
LKFAAARLASSELVYEDTYLQWYSAEDVGKGASVGQFVMLRCRGEEELDPLLPRAMSIHRLRRDAGQLQWSILFYVIGRGTRWLAQRRPDDVVFTYGPLGKGFQIRESAHNLLLVAGGIGVAPLIWLADEGVRLGKSVTLLLGARRGALTFPLDRIPPEVEVIVMTEDGSLGERGLVSEAFEKYLPWCDQVFACGPPAMFEALAGVRRRLGLRKPVQVLMEERMCCGTGVCYSCAAFTAKGVRLVCRDGPMFEVQDVYR